MPTFRASLPQHRRLMLQHRRLMSHCGLSGRRYFSADERRAAHEIFPAAARWRQMACLHDIYRLDIGHIAAEGRTYRRWTQEIRMLEAPRRAASGSGIKICVNLCNPW
ncbi:hypothetical protein [uncultured Bacteroides sp.]|uniref:hypothetical protein n=1 Tax=uncultured Bacteroides sp. TaxID=162156 RepID=UPI0025FF892C|nr:hypothetical protein [uncultured Bacteroides sp.]